MTIEKVNRIIYYYQLDITFHPTFSANDGNLFRELFHRVLTLVQAKDPGRYILSNDKTLFINDIDFDPSMRLIIGKIRMIKEEFPELIHKLTDVTREIAAAEEEGIAETTHFVIDYSKQNKYLAMEYYQSGAKYLDLVDYIREIGVKHGWIISINATNVVQDVLKTIKSRVNNVSEMYVKVSKTNVDALKKINTNLFKSLDVIQQHFEQDYAEIRLKFDYTDTSNNQKTRSTIMKIIDKFTKDKKHLNTFDTFKIRAEDSLKRNKLEAFNLLIDNLSSEVKIEKRLKSRVISSTHMFQQMKTELEVTRPRLK